MATTATKAAPRAARVSNAPDIIYSILKIKHMKQKELGAITGKRSTAINNRLRRSTITVTTLYDLVTALGYEVVIQPKKPGRRPEGQYVVEVGYSEEASEQ